MEERFDFIIMGSGLGGLLCAHILSDFGFKVCVLEKNQQLGGSLQVFARDKTVFDTGVHYVGALDPEAMLHRYFSYFGLMDTIPWRKMDLNGFDRITFPGDPTVYHHHQGWDAFEQELCRQFPDEAEAVRTYRRTIEQVAASFPLDRLELSETDHTDPLLLELSAAQFINDLTENKRLRSVLAGSALLHASTEEKCPLFVHALTTNGYMHGAYRCVDGGSQIAKQLAINIRQRGGVIVKRVQVNELLCENGIVVGARTKDGRIYRATDFISNIHPKNTFDLLPKDMTKGPYFKRIAAQPNSLSSFNVHIVCKPGSFPYLNHNIYHHRTDDAFAKADYKEEDWPLTVMLSTPATRRTEAFAEGITLMTYMRSSETAAWAQSHNTVVSPGQRGEGYEEFKMTKAEQMIAAIEEVFPNIRDCIQSVHCTTPLTFRDYIGNDDGSMYGLEKDHRSPLRTFIPPRTKVPNLYLTGQNINLHGMAGVTVSSIVTCSYFVGRAELLTRINAHSR
jgi:all-trans-retinol 13,14-reductase